MKSTVSSTPPRPSNKMTPIMTEQKQEDDNNSCYFPGCRKDANCNCQICLASINATLDLIQKSTLTKLSTSKPNRRKPVFYDRSILSTPESLSIRSRIRETPALKSTGRFRKNEDFEFEKEKEKKEKVKEKDSGFGVCCLMVILGLGLILGLEFGGSWVVSRVLNTDLSGDLVRDLGEKSRVLEDYNEKLGYLQKELQNVAAGKVLNCSYDNSLWTMNQDGLILHSRCTLYKSMTEVVSVWGWPLQTAGLLATGFSSQSFTILSGRVTEWSDGKMGYSIREAHDSWVSNKWNASVVHLDGNTWILEYRRCWILENPRLISAALKFLKLMVSRSVRRMQMRFWAFPGFEKADRHSYSSKIPT